MLIGVHPLLHSELLAALAAMGHGDCIALVDANFPAASVARETVCQRPLQLSCDAITALEAVLTHLPIDTFSPEVPPVQGMQVVGAPEAVPEVVAEAAPLLDTKGHSVALVERFAFYAAAKACFVILRTTEMRPYGNFILRKGVVLDD